MVTPRVENGTGCLQSRMAERAGVIDRCAPFELSRVLNVAVSTCNGGKNHRPFLGHRARHAHFTLNQLLLFDTSENQIIQLLLNGHALQQRV